MDPFAVFVVVVVQNCFIITHWRLYLRCFGFQHSATTSYKRNVWLAEPKKQRTSECLLLALLWRESVWDSLLYTKRQWALLLKQFFRLIEKKLPVRHVISDACVFNSKEAAKKLHEGTQWHRRSKIKRKHNGQIHRV